MVIDVDQELFSQANFLVILSPERRRNAFEHLTRTFFRGLVSYCWFNPQPMRKDHSIAGQQFFKQHWKMKNPLFSRSTLSFFFVFQARTLYCNWETFKLWLSKMIGSQTLICQDHPNHHPWHSVNTILREDTQHHSLHLHFCLFAYRRVFWCRLECHHGISISNHRLPQ